MRYRKLGSVCNEDDTVMSRTVRPKFEPVVIGFATFNELDGKSIVTLEMTNFMVETRPNHYEPGFCKDTEKWHDLLEIVRRSLEGRMHLNPTIYRNRLNHHRLEVQWATTRRFNSDGIIETMVLEIINEPFQEESLIISHSETLSSPVIRFEYAGSEIKKLLEARQALRMSRINNDKGQQSCSIM